VQIKTGTEVREILEDGVKAEQGGREVVLTGYDTIVLALGAAPVRVLKEQLEGKVAELHIIGDASSPRKAIDAIEEGAAIAVRI